MFWLIFTRLIVFILIVIVGTYSGLLLGHGFYESIAVSALFAGFVILVERALSKKKFRDVIIIMLGIFVGLAVGSTVAIILSLFPFFKHIKAWIFVLSNVVFVYLFGMYIYSRREEIGLWGRLGGRRQEITRRYKLLDTSVLIDGRIADIADTGFLEGYLAIPDFVLRELQKIADAKEHQRRIKGRRGMETIKRLKESPHVRVVFLDEDVPHEKEVDAKLVELARMKRYKLITTDYNLQKVAELRGVKVLNINQLALAIRPPLSAGDELKIKIIREGKEKNQGIGYLDDGTMVVVEDAIKYLGEEVECMVHSVIQSETGRIVFARLKGKKEA